MTVRDRRDVGKSERNGTAPGNSLSGMQGNSNVHPMRLGWIAASVVLLVGEAVLPAERIRLREGAEINGRVLAEKEDRIYVDVGYTVLEVPRTQILEISKAFTSKRPAKGAPRVAEGRGLYLVNSAPIPERTVLELVVELGESVVQVKTPGGLGSGFFVTEEGHLITNFHVIEGELDITVEVFHQQGGQLERRSYREVRILALDKFADLALLKIDVKSKKQRFLPIPLGDESGLKVGEKVFAIGSPLGLERTVTEGIISTASRVMQGNLYLQTTAQINPGNSGGPLFNLRGEVVGVTNMKIAFGEGLGFAIPVGRVRHFLEHREAFAYDNDNPNNGYRYLAPPGRTVVRNR